MWDGNWKLEHSDTDEGRRYAYPLQELDLRESGQQTNTAIGVMEKGRRGQERTCYCVHASSNLTNINSSAGSVLDLYNVVINTPLPLIENQ